MGEIEAKELYIFIQNDGDLYRQQGLSIIKNLVAKIDRGVYNRDLAVKLYMYLMESGAKKYVKEQGGGGGVWYQMFDKPSRELAAKNFVADFEAEYKLGNYNNLHAKKYQKAQGVLNNPARKNIKVGKTVTLYPYGVKTQYRITGIGKSGTMVLLENIKNGRKTFAHMDTLLGKKDAAIVAVEENPVGAKRVTKKEFYAAGGFANSSYFRKMVSGRWQYYKKAHGNPPYGYGTHENPVDYSRIFKVVNVKYADPGSGHGGPKARGIIADVDIDGDTKQVTYWRDTSEKYEWITEIYHGYGRGSRGFTKSNAYPDGRGLPAKYHALLGHLRVLWMKHFKSQ